MFNTAIYNKLLMSEAFQPKLKALANEITKSGQTASNEAAVAQDVNYAIKRFIREELGIRDFNLLPEVNESQLKFKFDGRMDAISNSLVIEYKHSSKLQTDTQKKAAIKQVIEYLEQLNEQEGINYRAILTDGIRIKYFYYSDNKIAQSNFSEINLNDARTIIEALLNVEHKRFLPKNIVEDFKLQGEESLTSSLAIALFDSINEIEMPSETRSLYEAWKAVFNLSDEDNGKSDDINKRRKEFSKLYNENINNNELDFKGLFSLQTTYTIIVKLIAAKIISSTQLSGNHAYFEDLSRVENEHIHEFMKYLEDGYGLQNDGILNLLEGDLFSWYTFDTHWNNELAVIIKKIIKVLDSYAHVSFKDEYEPIDIFKDLYMEVMPNAVRHSLGEYFTPSWLADRLVTESINQIEPENWKGIDPTCGSGIFQMTMIKKKLGSIVLSDLSVEEKNALLKQITESVFGIDMNPISVLTARVSYYLSILPLVTERTNIEIPVYLGNSAIIGEQTNLDEVLCYTVITGAANGFIKTTLPKSLVDNKQFLNKMNYLNMQLKLVTKDEWVEKFKASISFDCLNEKVEEEIHNLADYIYSLHEKNLSSYWLRLVTNQFLIAAIKEIDIIVGNPPWVKWEHLPQTYANNIKEQCLERHLFSGQTYMGAISLNICALISNTTASMWLKKGGILSFLMPKTLLTQDSYAGFRNFYLDAEKKERMYLHAIEDWSKSGDPFIYTNEKFATYYFKHEPVDYRESGVNVTYFKKKKNVKVEHINIYHNFVDVSSNFEITEGVAFQLDKERTGFSIFEGIAEDFAYFKDIIGECDYKARSGVEFTPYEIYTFEAVNYSDDKELCRFKNFSSASTIHKAVSVQPNGTLMETRYIKPIVKGSKIEPFKINFENEYGVFPYDPETTKVYDSETVYNESPKLYNYLVNYKSIIENQSARSKLIARGKEFYSLSKIGKYTFANYLVTFRDNSKMAAAVVQPVTTHWGEKVLPVCAKHAPYISMDKDGEFISEDEAYYIAAILNTPVVIDYFKFTYSSRSYSINFNIKIPKFDVMSELHLEMAKLSKLASDESSKYKLKQLQVKMNQLYLEMCKKS